MCISTKGHPNLSSQLNIHFCDGGYSEENWNCGMWHFQLKHVNIWQMLKMCSNYETILQFVVIVIFILPI